MSSRNAVPISPHGGALVNNVLREEVAAQRLSQAEHWPSVILTAVQLADLELLATGVFSPLTGFIGPADYESVVDSLRLVSGLPWSIPITLRVPKDLRWKHEITLREADGTIRGVVYGEGEFQASVQREARAVYGTDDPNHPGVARLLQESDRLIYGRVALLSRPDPQFPDLAHDPIDTRRIFAERGWRTIVGFQTRNPVHRAHEYIQKAALETVDGLLLHPLVGATKGDDVPPDVRVRCYRVLLDEYYPKDRVLLGAFPAAMRYAGPREAVLHAIARQNYGCTHFIVGRDHAGVGNYYGTYDAQRIFDRFAPGEIAITPVRFEHTFYCQRCENVGSPKTCPHGAADHVVLSGTRVRELLRAGVLPPAQFTRPEVAAILAEAYASPVESVV